MPQRTVLVVEDDEAIRTGIADALQFTGYVVLEAGDGEAGLEAALSSDCDLVLLDLVMPKRDGLEVLEEIRRHRPTLPVIILTARGDEADRVRGLRLGADDYVVKPFSVRELQARVDAVLRRSPERPAPVTEVSVPGGTADLPRREVRFEDGVRTELTALEARLLAYLASHAGRAIDRDELLSRVWRMNPRGIETRTIDQHIKRLREKLRDDVSDAKVVVTVRGKGYMFARKDA